MRPLPSKGSNLSETTQFDRLYRACFDERQGDGAIQGIMWEEAKHSLGSIWAWLGILAGALSFINLGVAYFEVGIGPVLEGVVTTYKEIVYPLFDFPFFWVDWRMPHWGKDVATLYLVISAAVTRGVIADNKLLRLNWADENRGGWRDWWM